MTKAFRSVLLFSLLCFLTLGVAWGQDSGNPMNPVDSQFSQNFGVDSVNLQNLSVDIALPVISKIGAIPFSYILLGNSGCVVVPSGPTIKDVECGIGVNKYILFNGLTPYPNWTLWGNSSINSEPYTQATMMAHYTTSTTGTCASDGLTYHKYSGWYLTSPNFETFYLSGFNIVGTACAVALDTYTMNGGLHVTIVNAGLTPSSLIAPNGYGWGSTSAVDTFGNSISYSSSTKKYTDTLADAVLTVTPLTASTAGSYTYQDTSSANQTVSEVLSATTVKTAFGCTGKTDLTQSANVISEVDYPDQHNVYLAYEPISGGTTGRLQQITLRTGGTVSYTYGTINCGSMIPSSLSRTTADGTSTYTFALSGTHGTTTTVLDPGKNKTVYAFQGTDATGLPVQGTLLTLTQVQTYQNTGTIAAPSYTLLSRVLYCYNGNATNCDTTQAAYPITEKDTYVLYGTMVVNSRVKQLFDAYGNVTESDSYDFGASSPTTKTAITYGSWNGTNCVGIGSGIINKPCRVQTTDNAAPAHVIADTTYSYLSNGFLSGENHWSGSAWITTMTASANGNGTVNQRYNSLGTPTTYNYAATGSGGCNALFPTHTSTLVGSANLTTDATWDCNMGKLLSATDENTNTSNFTYDLLGRPLSQSYPASAVISETYPSAVKSTVGNTFTTTTRIVDGYGLNPFVQTTDGASYDTTSTGQGFNGLVYYQFNTSQPCIAALNAGCTINHFARLDPLGRQFYESTTGNETVNTVYYGDATHSVFDVQTTMNPAPSGEHTKVSQIEYDGLGRVKSTCAIQTTGGTSCGQAIGGSGIKTSFTYTYAAGQTTVAATRGSQTHTTVYDAMGRVKSVATPEAGTTTYIYDQASASCSSGSAPGFLMEVVDNAGVHTCQGYDSLGRPTNTFVAGTSNPCRVLVYGDQYSGTPSVTNAKTRLAEAWTDSDCSGSSKITDEYFSYDPDGRMLDAWETTPNSGGQYHSTAAYALNGQLTSLSGVASAYTIVLDSNGRPYTSKYGTTVVGNGTTYNAAGQTTEIDTGTGSDKDVYTYDANTGLMTTWAFTINSVSENATLTWNANRSLKTLAITDGFNAGGTQTCHYNPTDAAGSGYDDVGRLVGVNCGTPWTQTYTYDQYNNFSKSGTTMWNPGYSATNNHITGAGYDSDGQVTYDLNNSYAWDGYHKMITANAGASLGSCGAAGVTCITYDAFGRPAEKNVAGTITEMLYSPIGLTGIMSGQTANNFRVRIPGGAIFDGSIANGNLVSHVDWLGSARVEYSLGHACKLDTAYSPYGEKYANFCNAGYVTFTGDYQNLYSGLYDTPNREFDTSSGSRWLSPDPARASWNAYSYPTNPNSMTDTSGLRPCPAVCDQNTYVDANLGGFASVNATSLGISSGAASSIYRGSSNFGTYNVVQPAGYTTASPDGDLYTLTSTMKATGTFANGTNVIDLFTGRNVGNGFVNQTPSTLPHGGQHIKPSKNWTFRPLINGTEWFYNLSGRKWTSDGDGPTSFSDSPDTWNQLETNKGIPAGDNIQVEPTKFLFDDGSGAGLKWVDVGAGAGAGAGLSLLDAIGIAMEGGPLVGAYSYGAWQYAQQGANFVEQGVIPVSSFGVPTQ